MIRPGLTSIAACLLSLAAATIVGAGVTSTFAPVDFGRDIRPIFSDTCYTCHGPDEATREAELRLDTKSGAFADLGGHPAITPNKPDQSELYRRITSTDADERMPPADSGRQLTSEQIELVRRWIAEGAVWQDHWSFVPPERPALPPVAETSWARNPIDSFILAKLEQQKLAPSPEAAKETLLRRVTIDLTGLPPTLAELEAFLADESPDAYERAVDRLLSSPRYGEHMAAEWLDAARYSDSNGYQRDGTRTIWPWRDWVIAALNQNMPFDRFTIEQLSGDLLPDATNEQKLATGFNRNHMLNGEGGRIPEESRVEYVIDRVETTSTVWLGLTVGCARCHDHKYDPVSQKEFYRMYALFNNVAEKGDVDRGGNATPVMKMPTAQEQASLDELRGEIAVLEAQNLPAGAEQQESQTQLETLKKKLAELDKSILETMVMAERPEPREAYVLVRGLYDQPDKNQPVSPGVPASLPPLPADAPPNRLALARWLVDPAHPLTARVTVNRWWQQLFGTGLVKTTEDFGSQGERPTHPELLDWLATELVSSGWDVKAMHRLLVTSAAYRQSSQATPELLARDPYNRLLARGPRFRLSSLAIRDLALNLGGLLVEQIGGAPVKPYQPEGVWTDFSLGKIKYEQDHGAALYRRSLYTFWRRSVSPTMFFDASARQVCTVRIDRTNTPLHSLTLMNDITFVEAARALAQRIMTDEEPSPEARLARAFRMATARQPTASEMKVLLEGFQRVLRQYKEDQAAASELVGVGESPREGRLDVVELAAYTSMMNVILNLDETITKE